MIPLVLKTLQHVGKLIPPGINVIQDAELDRKNILIVTEIKGGRMIYMALQNVMPVVRLNFLIE